MSSSTEALLVDVPRDPPKKDGCGCGIAGDAGASPWLFLATAIVAVIARVRGRTGSQR